MEKNKGNNTITETGDKTSQAGHPNSGPAQENPGQPAKTNYDVFIAMSPEEIADTITDMVATIIEHRFPLEEYNNFQWAHDRDVILYHLNKSPEPDKKEM